MSPPLFVYGTLMFDEVLLAVLNRVPATEPAAAKGWRAAALAGRPYPGLVRAEGVVRGTLLHDLQATEWRQLNDYEAEEYRLGEIELTDGRRALAYIWQDGSQVLSHDWEPDHVGVRRSRRRP